MFDEKGSANLAYLLKCECGRPLTVPLGAAGTLVSCDCGRSLKVPSLSELSALPEVAGPTPSAHVANTDNWFARLSLSVGVVVSVLSCVSSFFVAVVWYLMTDWPWKLAVVPLWAVFFLYSAGMAVVFARARR